MTTASKEMEIEEEVDMMMMYFVVELAEVLSMATSSHSAMTVFIFYASWLLLLRTGDRVSSPNVKDNL